MKLDIYINEASKLDKYIENIKPYVEKKKECATNRYILIGQVEEEWHYLERIRVIGYTICASFLNFFSCGWIRLEHISLGK